MTELAAPTHPHVIQPAYQKLALIVLGLVAFCYGLAQAKAIIVPLLFAMLLNPLLNFLTRHLFHRMIWPCLAPTAAYPNAGARGGWERVAAIAFSPANRHRLHLRHHRAKAWHGRRRAVRWALHVAWYGVRARRAGAVTIAAGSPGIPGRVGHRACVRVGSRSGPGASAAPGWAAARVWSGALPVVARVASCRRHTSACGHRCCGTHCPPRP